MPQPLIHPEGRIKPVELFGASPNAPDFQNQLAIQEALNNGGLLSLTTQGVYKITSTSFTNGSISSILIGPGISFEISGSPIMPTSLSRGRASLHNGILPGLSSPTSIPEVIFDVGPDGKFLFTQYDGTYGQFLSQLSIATGTATAMTKTALTATNASNLKTSAGTALVAADIFCAWWISTTRFLFAVRGLNGANQNCCFLFLCNFNGSAWTVGANASLFDDQKAVLNMGTTGGVSVANNIILHSRSLAKSPGVSPSKIIIGDYNVASGRVDGGTKDQVQVYQSTDQGVTWSTLLSFNTSGNQIRHMHSVKYDKYRSQWYFMFGDAPKNSIVRWDGTSAAPAANTALSSFGSYPGWEVLTGSYMYETGDIAIHPDKLYYIPDDTGVADHTELQSIQLTSQSPLSSIQGPDFLWSKSNPARAPLICMETPNGGSIWGSLYSLPEDSERGFDFWGTADGVIFEKIASARDYTSASSGVLANIFMLPEQKVCISGTASRGVRLWNPSVSNNYGSIICNLVAWGGKELRLNY